MDLSKYKLNKSKSSAKNIPATENKTVSILLIEKLPKASSMLKKALKDFDYLITKHISFEENIIKQIELCQPDILIMATDLPSDKLLNQLADINQLLPLPIVIFAEHDTPKVIQSAIEAGVSAYVVNEIFPQRLKSIISVANERFKATELLRNELRKAKTQLESRKYIERAKGLIMQQKQISENEAYGTLRKMAMDQGNSLAIVSKNIIDVCELLSTPTPTPNC